MNIKSPPRRPVPRLTRKSAKEMQAWRHAKMMQEVAAHKQEKRAAKAQYWWQE